MTVHAELKISLVPRSPAATAKDLKAASSPPFKRPMLSRSAFPPVALELAPPPPNSPRKRGLESRLLKAELTPSMITLEGESLSFNRVTVELMAG